MNVEKTHLAFDSAALFAKSQLYISRGYRSAETGDLEEYQLWASLGMELLGKSTLSSIHPTLIADPENYQSLFAACGVPRSIDVKTIGASTLFKRLGKLSKEFDHRVEKFCSDLSIRRNSELHSGESPFSGMNLDAWENQFWNAVDVLLRLQDKNLNDWLNADDAKAKKQLLHDATEARKKAISARVENRREEFLVKMRDNPDKRKALIENSANVSPHEFTKKLVVNDSLQLQECPSCGGFGVVGGSHWDESVVDQIPDPDHQSPPTEIVDTTYVVEEFWCPLCQLRLDGTDEIEASGIISEFIETSDREMEFEPDYGND